MIEVTLIIVCVALLLLLAWAFFAYRTQSAAMTGVLHLVSNMAQGQYARRTDPLLPGLGGELARASNMLAEEMEKRSSGAQQDKDHLLSLLAVMDQSNEIAIATDNMDMIRLANPAASRVLDRPVGSLLGKHIETVIHHPDLMALYRNAFSSNKPVSAQIAMQAPGRTIHCSATAATIYNGAHYKGTLLLMRDVTEVARTLQMKADFVANASHELRTPLASIRAAVETIKEGDGDEETTRRCVDIINNHALRLQLMVQDLLDLSRTEDGRAVVQMDRLDLHQICDMITGMYAGNAKEKQVQLHVDFPPEAQTFRGDERLVTLTLKNLVDNAIKATFQGSVTIRSRLQAASSVVRHDFTAHHAVNGSHGNGSQGRDVDLATEAEANEFVLEVQDSGCGIPKEDQERVFERFYTVNRSRGGADRGTGLGLAIVKHAVGAMGGRVELTSEVGKGTTIRCVFPIRS
ncbi:MAG TPA: ATP-binding protein [Phycisphaerae bacterium]|nr:ATP-binding protein [Phycisphaerae bacterium]